jgi:outer membrane lipoprotein-sorting protein
MNRPTSIFRTAFAGAALAAAGAAVSLPAAARPAPADAPQVTNPQIDGAIAALRAITTMRADFVQIDNNGRSVTGVLTLKRPGQIRFQYEKSVPLLIVSDGHALTVIDYGVSQVQRWPIRSSPLGALLDPSRDMAGFARLQPGAPMGGVGIEMRDPKHPEYGAITLNFVHSAAAPGGMELVSWLAFDSQNRRTLVRLSNQRYGLDVPNDTFRWRDPRPAVHR